MMMDMIKECHLEERHGGILYLPSQLVRSVRMDGRFIKYVVIVTLHIVILDIQ